MYKEIDRVRSRLALSPWGLIDLTTEEQIRDFLIDLVLDEPAFLSQLAFVRKLFGSTHHLTSDDHAAWDQIDANIVHICFGRLAKRDGQALLHVRPLIVRP